MNTDSNYLENILEELTGCVPPENCGSELDIDEKKILQVTEHHLIASAHSFKSDSKHAESLSTLILKGTSPTEPETGPVLAIIPIIEDGQDLPAPAYTGRRIYLRIHRSDLPTVLALLHEPHVHCCIKKYGDGHVRADVHAHHKN